MISTQDIIQEAWEELQKSIVYYQGEPVGTLAARDPSGESLNYNQVFTRDFFVSALAFISRGETDIVRNFLAVLVDLQASVTHYHCFQPGLGVMPASFAIERQGSRDSLKPDFGQYAIARVAPMDSGFWWLILLQAYVKATGDVDLARSEEFQNAIALIVSLSLQQRFDMYPTMLAPDGAYMIDRRMGVYGYPFDLQALFFSALCAARELLLSTHPLHEPVINRMGHLLYHIRSHYWLDIKRLNQIYRFKVEEYGSNILNIFNVYPESIPDWIFSWMPENGGYFMGNVGPGRFDFRYFAQGNLISVLSSLATAEQAVGIFDLMQHRSGDLMGTVPLKLCYPALEGRDWEIITGADPKNTAWSYHNGGNWPFLVWLYTAASIRIDRSDEARQILAASAARLREDGWPEYYDGRQGRYIGKEARTFQTWTLAGLVAADGFLCNPSLVSLVSSITSPEVVACSEQVEAALSGKA